MKYIKEFEMIENDIKVGDTLYCIDNTGVKRDLEIGEKYTVDDVLTRFDSELIIRLKETESRWLPFRFTKDPNHPVLVELNAKKYNL